MESLIFNQSDLSDAEILRGSKPVASIDGHALLEIEQFAFTSNNVTYGVAPSFLKYWDFFPIEQDGFGRLPVWGFAKVIESKVDEISVGDRFYGYLPTSSHLLVQPGAISLAGFTDFAPHRQPMSGIYNRYSSTKTDAQYSQELEGHICLFRPLFMTSFLLEDHLRSNKFFGTEQIILTSASSKTAISLAYLLSNGKGPRSKVVGLTSARNKEFVIGLGCYDDVILYDDLKSLPGVSTAYVDMAGNGAVTSSLHHYFGDDLKHACQVGGTHWEEGQTKNDDLPGGRPEFFFAPSYFEQRANVVGAGQLQDLSTTAWHKFIGWAASWIEIQKVRGVEACMDWYHKVLKGEVPPRQGVIMSF